MTYTESFPIRFASKVQDAAVVLAPNVRFSLLTSRLFRLEYSPTATFEDRPSQAFWYRQQPVPEYEVRHEAGKLEIETNDLLLQFQQSPSGFSAESLSITLKRNGVTWNYGQIDTLNLKGTTRTLDDIDGAVSLEDGLMSRSGWALWNDTRQLLFSSDGWLTPRTEEQGYCDLYFFGYGNDYYDCLRDFCKVAGEAPMLPRWAFGNWWSRYWNYSEDELLALMDEFQARHIPLSVCIVDMDWHIVDTGNTSSGWTGYTWNRSLFPDPPAFIAALHNRGLKTALNLHPAEGIHPHEEQYNTMSKLLGIDPKSAAPIPFDIGDQQFTQAYFEQLHHPYEEQGIDFWWLDWQQGTVSSLPELDPLWWLNHLHFYDLAREGNKRPFIFSRWGGLGNHRYPIGFSGDTHVSWKSLAFQPYFTATAANVNYGWWSHDIGGHMSGVEDPELFARWVQFGVLSPILRLHATKNPYHERRPWGYDSETERVTSEALRFRHQLIPYLQTMAWRNHVDSIPLVRPMYYDHPQNEQAYHCPDQYLFGSELLAAPFTSPVESDTRLARQVIWLPEGNWFDFFSGDFVSGDAWHAVLGTLDDIPLFAKAGAIVPLGPHAIRDGDDSQDLIRLHLFPVSDGFFYLHHSNDTLATSRTSISHEWREQEWLVEIDPYLCEGEFKPAARTYEICFRAVHSDIKITAELGGQPVDIAFKYDPSSKSLKTSPITIPAQNKLTLALTTEEMSLLAQDDRQMRIGQKLLQNFRMNTNTKLKLAAQLSRIQDDPALLAAYQLSLTANQLQALAELMTGSGVHRRPKHDDSGDEIVLWNNHSSDSVNMRFVAEEPNGPLYSTHRPLPKFALLTIGHESLTYHDGIQSAQGRLTVEGWFATLLHRIPRGQVNKIDAVIQFEIFDVKQHTIYLVMAQGDLSLHEGSYEKPDVTITAHSNDFLSLINADQTPEEMFLAGALRIGGNLELIIGLVDAFHLAPPGTYRRNKWRLDINYLDALTLEQGER